MAGEIPVAHVLLDQALDGRLDEYEDAVRSIRVALQAAATDETPVDAASPRGG